TLARWLRSTGLPRLLAGPGSFGFGMGMLAASEPARRRAGAPDHVAAPSEAPAHRPTGALARVALFRGCVMDTLFAHVHKATQRTLEANGYAVIEVSGQACCGALHQHAGDAAAARALLAANAAAFADKADYIVVNSAGCGALLREAPEFSGRVRDVTELLAEAGPLPGAPFPCEVAYDP